MEIILELSLFLPDPDATDDDDDDTAESIELEKSIELPFAPYENLDLILPGASQVLLDVDEDELESVADWITISPELASGLFRISQVAFDMEAGRFLAQADIDTGDATSQAIESFAAHLVTSFGFERREADDND